MATQIIEIKTTPKILVQFYTIGWETRQFINPCKTALLEFFKLGFLNRVVDVLHWLILDTRIMCVCVYVVFFSGQASGEILRGFCKRGDVQISGLRSAQSLLVSDVYR